MVLSLKNSLSDLIIRETQIMEMYLILDIDSNENLISHICMSLRLLEWNKKLFLGTAMGIALEDHFMSIKHGLKFLVKILKISRDTDLKLRIQHLVGIVKQKLYTLPHNQEDENVIVNLDHAYGGLREEMQNVVMKPGTNDYDTLFPKNLSQGYSLRIPKDFLLVKIRKLITSSCKADQIAPIMKELEELRKKLISLKPLFDQVSAKSMVPHLFAMKEDEEKILATLTTFLDRATCLVYFSFVGKLNDDMLVSVRKNFSLLFQEIEINKISLALGMSYEDLESDIDISLTILKRQEEYHIGTINELMLKDHIMSLYHGIEFLKWIPKTYIDRDMERRIILLARDVKQKLQLLTYEQGDESLNMDVNHTYAILREEMKNVIINPETDKYDTLFPEFSQRNYHYRYHDFLLEKITALVTSNLKAGQIAPMKKELKDLQKMLAYLKPLGRYVGHKIRFFGSNIFTTLLTIHHKATFLIYLSFIGKMDIEMVLLVKNNIATAVEETDIKEIYTTILNEVLLKSDYVEEELYILENLILLLKTNLESLNDACSKLYEVLIDIHIFLLGLSPNVLLRKLHLLQPILGHSIPIICSCYLEHTEAEISGELDWIFSHITYIKSEAQEIKLYYFPRIDDLGFLKFFLGYLEDLMKNQEISMKEVIDALHFEVHSLLSLIKVTNQELNESPWTYIINMAYQAEYIIDLYLVSGSRDLGLLSSLSRIIEEFKNIRVDVQGLCSKGFLTQSTQNFSETSKLRVLGTTTQIGDHDEVVGLQEEARIINECLLKSENKLDFITIIGMAGVGKTTLALTLYNTPTVADYFDILAWCSVSQSYEVRELVLSILDQVDASDISHRSILEYQELVDHFCRRLKKRRYLIVLDDIWDTTVWNYLKHYLPDDRNGSRILITTRNRDVADQIGGKVNELHGLSEEKSWELFQKKMLEKESLSDNLLKISKGIVEHCKGLPLSIVIIAGILSDIERTEKKWNQIAESVSSLILSDSQGRCKAILELSYNHLPNHLRSCFLFMGSFPEGQEISVNRLIALWIAEGLVRDTKLDSAEEVSRKYMEDLIVKSLVIPAKERSRGGVKTFRLHDLLRDFCLDKAREKNLFTMLDKRNYARPLQDPRRLIINGHRINGLHFSCHSIRSLICFDNLEASDIEKRIASCDMVLLKVLEVRQVWSDHFPNLSSLVHLRYLAFGLRNGEISVFPSSISKLQNLQTIILRSVCDVMEVPDLIFDMVKLRHVHISPKALFQVESNRLQNSSFLLENLRFLSNACVSCGDSKWLSKFSGLQKLHCVFMDDHLYDKQFQMLSFNSHITSLKVENAARRKQRFMSTCQLPIKLRELTLSQFSLTSNDISDIGRALHHLEVFKIYKCPVPSGFKWNVDDEGFPGLKVLKLSSLNISKWIASENSFPCLEQLWVEKCEHLDEIPLVFGYLLKLRLISVRECEISVDNSARIIEKMQHEEQNTEMIVRIYPKIIATYLSIISTGINRNYNKS